MSLQHSHPETEKSPPGLMGATSAQVPELDLQPVDCPVCGSPNFEEVFAAYTGPAVSSDFNVYEGGGLHNRCCQGCGLIFNASGIRGQEKEFYRDSYSLMMHSDEAGVKSFSNSGAETLAQRSCDIMCEMLDLPSKGRVLEAGAGKGHFSSIFAQRFPDWDLTALEPGQAFAHLKKNLPDASLHNCAYRDLDPLRTGHDLVVAMGVWEHVSNPLDFLLWVRERLVPGGRFFLRVPNFAHNPNDLFCVDHLSKLTQASISDLARRAGFEVEKVHQQGVPIFASLRRTKIKAGEALGCFAENLAIARANADYMERCLDAVSRGLATARSRKEGFAIFGLAQSCLFAPIHLGFDPEGITAYLDENTSMHSYLVHGRPVVGLDAMAELGIKHASVTISPVYVEQVSGKLAARGVKTYLP